MCIPKGAAEADHANCQGRLLCQCRRCWQHESQKPKSQFHPRNFTIDSREYLEESEENAKDAKKYTDSTVDCCVVEDFEELGDLKEGEGQNDRVYNSPVEETNYAKDERSNDAAAKESIYSPQ